MCVVASICTAFKNAIWSDKQYLTWCSLSAQFCYCSLFLVLQGINDFFFLIFFVALLACFVRLFICIEKITQHILVITLCRYSGLQMRNWFRGNQHFRLLKQSPCCCMIAGQVYSTCTPQFKTDFKPSWVFYPVLFTV